MEPRDIDITLNIKNFKAGKFIHLYATEAIADFQRSHPKMTPYLLECLKIGNPRQSLKAAEELEEVSKNFHKSIKKLRKLIEEYMVSELAEKQEGMGDKYIATDGSMGFSFQSGKEKVIVASMETDKKEEGKDTSIATPDGNIGTTFEKEKEVVEVAFGKDKEK